MTQSRIQYDRNLVLGSSDNTVYTGTYDGNSCAVKRILKPSGLGREAEIKNVKREMGIWITLNENADDTLPVVRWFGYQEDEDFWYLAAEKYDGNLAQLIRREAPFTQAIFNRLLTIEDKIQLALQAANGLALVHEHNFLHKDIKPNNFVVRFEEGKWVCKLTDFGFSKEKVEGASHCSRTRRLGTRDWGIAPELLNTNQQPAGQLDLLMPFSWNCDVWAMGLVIHFIFTDGQHAYGENIRHRLDNIINNQPSKEGKEMLLQISQYHHFRVDELVRQMIHHDPNERPTMQQVVETIQHWHVPAEPTSVPFGEF